MNEQHAQAAKPLAALPPTPDSFQLLRALRQMSPADWHALPIPVREAVADLFRQTVATDAAAAALRSSLYICGATPNP